MRSDAGWRTPLGLWAVAAGLLVAVVVCVGLWWSTGQGHWEEIWLPNLGAELFGLFVGVVILELFVGYTRRRDHAASEAPLRLELARDIRRLLRPLLNFLVWTWSANHDHAPVSDLRTFLGSWDEGLVEHRHLSDGLWLRQFASLLAEVSTGARELGINRQSSRLPPELVAAVHESLLELDQSATVLAAIASSAELSAPAERSVTRDTARHLPALIAPLLDAHEHLAREELTTYDSWLIWQLIHSVRPAGAMIGTASES
jgi:hypothetical protein